MERQRTAESHIIIILNNYCDNRCFGCIGEIASRGEQKADIALSTLESIVRFDEVYTAGRSYTVGFTGGGEPTLSPRLFTAVEAFTRTAHPPRLFALVTNGHAFSTDELTIKFLDRFKTSANEINILIQMSADEYHANTVGDDEIRTSAKNLVKYAEERKIHYAFKVGVPAGTTGQLPFIVRRFGLPEKGEFFSGIECNDWNSEKFLKDEKNCKTPKNDLLFNYNGDIYLRSVDYVLKKPTGNINTATIQEVLKALER